MVWESPLEVLFWPLREQLLFVLQLIILRSNWAPDYFSLPRSWQAQHAKGSQHYAPWQGISLCISECANQASFSSFTFPNSCLLHMYSLLRTE